MPIDWKGSSTLITIGLVSAVCWLGFLFTVTVWQSESIGVIFLLIAIITLLRFGQLLDKHLKDIL